MEVAKGGENEDICNSVNNEKDSLQIERHTDKVKEWQKISHEHEKRKQNRNKAGAAILIPNKTD